MLERVLFALLFCGVVLILCVVGERLKGKL